MAKNMTRKGLALGAAFALVSSALVATPALAANEVTLAPSVGTSYGMVSGQAFTLQATTGSTISSGAYSTLKYKVDNAGEATVTSVLTQTGSTGHTNTSSAATSFVVESNAGTVTGSTSTLAVSVANTVAGSVVVTAWLDANGNDVIDNNEFASDARTVTFVKPANVTWTTAVTAPKLGDTKVVSNVTASNDVNVAQLASKVTAGHARIAGVTYTHLGVSASTTTGLNAVADSAGAFTKGEATTYVAATNSLKAELTHNVTAGTYLAQAVFGFVAGDTAADTAGTEIGAESLASVAAATVVRLDTPVVASAGNVLNGSTTASSVRNGTSSVAVSVQAYSAYTDATTNTKAAAGTVVKVTITEGSAAGNTDAATFTAGGKTLKDTTAAADKIELELTADANGKVSFDLAVAGTVAGTDSIVISSSSQGVAGQTGNTVSFIATTAGQMVNTNVLGTNAIMKVAAGSTYSLNYAVEDNFGGLLTGAYRVALSNGTTTVFAPVVNGQVSFSLTDSTTVTESYSAQLQVLNNSTQNYDVSGNAVTFTPTVGSSNAAATSTLVATGSNTNVTALALNNSALTAADTRLGQSAPTVLTAAATAAGNVATLSGQVSDAQGVFTYSSVTLSATGVLFNVGDVYALNSITVQTNASGAFDGVKLYSNTSGEVTVTATAGAATKTVKVTFVAAALTAGATLTITAPDNVMPGSTLAISAKLVDKWGNPVAATATQGFKYSYTGPGIQVGTAPTAFGTDGVAKLGYLLGTNDSGSITVTFSYDGDNTASTTADNITSTKTITIGAAETKVAAFTKRAGDKIQIVSQGSAKVRFMLNGKRVATRSSLGTLNRTFDLVDGKNVIEIYVDGKRVLRRAATK